MNATKNSEARVNLKSNCHPTEREIEMTSHGIERTKKNAARNCDMAYDGKVTKIKVALCY